MASSVVGVGRRRPAGTLRRRPAGTLVSFCLLASVLLIGATTASASNLRPFLGSFAADLPAGVAVDQQTGNVYVVETNLGVVAAFGPGGGPPSSGVPAASHVITPGSSEPEGVAVDNSCFYHVPRLTGSACEAFDPSNGNLYVADARGNAVKKLALNALTEEYAVVQEFPFVEPTGVAVDHVGNVYVADYFGDMAKEAGAISEFDPTGKEIGVIQQATIGNPFYITVGTPGVVYVGGFEGQGVAKIEVNSADTVLSETLLDSNGGAVAVEAAGHALVDDGSQISEYSPAGTLLGAYGSGHFMESKGLAVNEETQHAYVSSRTNGANAVAIFGALVTVPDVTTSEATNLTSASGQATLNGTVNPDGVAASSCEFEYGTTTAYGSSAPCSPDPGSGTAPVPVSANLTGLAPAVVYHYRLIAANANGSNPGADRTFIAPGVVLDRQWTSKVTATSANLHAEINPNGVSTTYRFEYGTTTSYGHTAPIPDGQAGKGTTPVSVELPLSELQPDTTYHYRTIATGLGTETGADLTFTTQTAGGEPELPDNRQWQLVSPPDKHGALIRPIREDALIQAATSGNAITYLATAPTEDQPQGNSQESQLLSTRTPSGWATKDLASPSDSASGHLVNEQQYKFFSSDLSLAALQPTGPFSPSISPEASEQTAYLRTNYSSSGEACPTATQKAEGVSCFRPLVTGKPGFANVPEGDVFTNLAANKEPVLAGVSHDLHHVLVESPYSLTAPGKTETPGLGLYEWTAGTLTFVAEDNQHGVESVSDDGSRVVFRPNAVNALLLRDVPLGDTVRLDVPEPDCLAKATCGEGDEDPEFQSATGDGSKVFFTDTRRLTADAGAAKTHDLYECDLVVEAGAPHCQLHDLTPPGAAKEDAQIRGHILGTSSDGSWVYFAANGNLEGGVSHGTCGSSGPVSTGGRCNLYVRHDGLTKLITTLRSDDQSDWEVLTKHAARVSPSGEWLAFMSDASLTGYDNRDVVSSQPDEEVYLYHATTATLVCASCDPTGARPAGVEYEQIAADAEHTGLAGGNSVWESQQWIAANVPAWTPYDQDHASYQSRYLSDSGRLFFNSSDALVPQDVNHTEDVYEYEQPGMGGCTTASRTFHSRSQGCVGLISSGEGAGESGFVDASETGGDVFFLTSSQLSKTDVDTAIDVYDAHECAPASPCMTTLAQSPPCDNGDACKPAPTPQPEIFGSPASATYSGAGNAAAERRAAKPKPLTNAQRLAVALRLCRKQHAKKRRVLCEHRARKRYEPQRKAKRSGNSRPGGKK